MLGSPWRGWGGTCLSGQRAHRTQVSRAAARGVVRVWYVCASLRARASSTLDLPLQLLGVGPVASTFTRARAPAPRQGVVVGALHAGEGRLCQVVCLCACLCVRVCVCVCVCWGEGGATWWSGCSAADGQVSYTRNDARNAEPTPHQCLRGRCRTGTAPEALLGGWRMRGTLLTAPHLTLTHASFDHSSVAQHVRCT